MISLEEIKLDLKNRLNTILDLNQDIILEYPIPEFGDIALPCFQFSAKLKKSPNEIANFIKDNLDLDYIDKIEVKAAYLNIYLKSKNLYTILDLIDSSKENAIKEKIVIEFCSPNTNKPLHLGHLRNIALGESISAIIKSQGHKVVKTQIFNDRGIALAKMMLIYDKFYKDTEDLAIDTKKDHFTGKLYTEFEQKVRDNPEFEAKAQDILKKWESKDPYWYDIWLKLRNLTVEGQRETFDRLNTSFDEELFESDIYQDGKDEVLKGFEQGIFKKHPETNYIYADLAKFNLANKILIRSNGTSLYITQDIALLKRRLQGESKCYAFDKMIYITALEQNLQFQQLFAIVNQLGIKTNGLYHIGYGFMRIPEGKMSSRKGTVVNIDNLLNTIENEILQEYFLESDLSLEEKTRRIKIIAKASYLFYLLHINSKKDIVFDTKSSIKLQGKTGPYILYTVARLNSILAKSSPILNKEYDYTEERELILHTIKFWEYRDMSAHSFDPSILAQYLYDLSVIFNTYYHQTKVIGDKNESAKAYILSKVNNILKYGLSLLKIEILEKM